MLVFFGIELSWTQSDYVLKIGIRERPLKLSATFMCCIFCTVFNLFVFCFVPDTFVISMERMMCCMVLKVVSLLVSVVLPQQSKGTLQCLRQHVGSALMDVYQVQLWQVLSSSHVNRIKIFVDVQIYIGIRNYDMSVGPHIRIIFETCPYGLHLYCSVRLPSIARAKHMQHSKAQHSKAKQINAEQSIISKR